MIKNIFRSPITYCFVLLVTSIFVFLFSGPKMENVRVTRGSVEEDVLLPYSANMERRESFVVKLDAFPGWDGSVDVEIIPDDCVKSLFINEVKLNVHDFPGYCDWTKGFKIQHDVLDSIVGKASRYHFEMVVENGGGLGGVSAFVSSESFFKKIAEFFLFVAVAGLIFLIGCKFRVRKRILLLVVLGVFLRIVFTQDTSYRKWTYDVDGHLEYIGIVADQHRIPEAKECWSCYHPVLYYASMAPVKIVTSKAGLSSINAFQWCSFLMSVAMMILGLIILRNVCGGGVFWLSAILWTFWPGIILSSPRIGNDIPFYLAHVLSLWGCVRYINADKGKYILIAVIAAFAAYWFKTTGAITIGLVGLTFFIHFVPRFFSYAKKAKLEYASLGLFVGLSATIAAIVLMGNGLIANTGNLNGRLQVGNAPGNFLYFDIPGFLTHPFTSAWNDGQGREYFFNYLAKTSLFGEFNLTSSELGVWLASVISLLFIVLLVVGIMGLWKMRWNKLNVLLGVQGFVFILAEAYLRYKYPFSCSNDFRFIIPGLISYTYAVGNGFFAENASVRLKVFGGVTTVMFATCSVWLLLIL